MSRRKVLSWLGRIFLYISILQLKILNAHNFYLNDANDFIFTTPQLNVNKRKSDMMTSFYGT